MFHAYEYGQGEDLNGDGDMNDVVLHVADLSLLSKLPRFVRGDCNGDGSVAGTVSDAVFLLQYNFAGGRAPLCLDACDADGNGTVLGQVTDAVYLLQFNFSFGPPPLPPFPNCGPDPLLREPALDCNEPVPPCN